MSEGLRARVAIVDYGLGNLFSIQHACRHAGMDVMVTVSKTEILEADAVLLPGVGAFGDAMQALRRLDLVSVLKDVAASDTRLIGICLGMQLLMMESEEFGRHRGLGILEGRVVRLLQESTHPGARRLKVPEVGWNCIREAQAGRWEGTLLEGVPDGAFMYFVHSFVVQPDDPTMVVSLTRYGPNDYCSTLQRGHLFACQYHPERSGPQGLRIYQRLASQLSESLSEAPQA